MIARLRSWWQKEKKLVIVGFIVLLVVIVLIYIGYQFSWTGFPNKTLWDWFQLLGVLAIPVAVGFGTVWFTQAQQHRDQQLAQLQHDRDQQLADQRAKSEREAAEKRAETEREIAIDNQHEAALQAYIDKLSELLLKEHLSESKPEYEEVRNIALVRTLTVLPRLDAIRKRSIIEFLYASRLIERNQKIIQLAGADLRGAYLRETNLYNAYLYEVDLSEANLHKTDLVEADLAGADLWKADLSGAELMRADLVGADLSDANLSGVDLSDANLTDAIVTIEQLNTARSLTGATMPDGTKHE